MTSSPAPLQTAIEAHTAMEAIVSQLHDIQRLSYLLMFKMENDLDLDRGKVDGTMVTLRFQKSGIDVSTWLASDVWSRSADVLDKAENFLLQLERAAE